MTLKGTPEFLERLIAPINNPICRDLCRFFAYGGWDIDVSHEPRRAIAMIPSGYGEGPATVDLWALTYWLTESRIMREG